MQSSSDYVFNIQFPYLNKNRGIPVESTARRLPEEESSAVSRYRNTNSEFIFVTTVIVENYFRR